MRRRRLIGMYRVLLKSMIWCAPDDKGCDPRRSCREGQERETEREPGLTSNLSDWPTKHNRSGPPGAEFYRADCGFKAVVLTICSRYLGAQVRCRNEAAVTISVRIGTRS